MYLYPSPGDADQTSTYQDDCQVNAINQMVIFQVEAVGICAGDAKTYAGAIRFWGKNRVCKTL